MNDVICVYKPIGMTPLQAIELLKNKYPEYSDKKISYAGRLDPMAEGVLVLLLDEANNKRKEFENLNKTYECDVLFGVSTDTYDTLGLITNTHKAPQISPLSLIPLISQFKSVFPQPYPPYSSKAVRGKPLYYWARQNKLSEITIPTKEITISSIEMINQRDITSQDLHKEIIKRLEIVKGDFRQDLITTSWDDYFKTNQQPLLIISLRVTCSSGTYIRSLANSLGEKIGIPAIAYTIKRTNVGTFTLEDCLNILVS